MSELEIREILKRVCEELDARAVKAAVLTAGLALASMGCRSTEPAGTDEVVALYAAPSPVRALDAQVAPPIPEYMAVEPPMPMPAYMPPEPIPTPAVDAGTKRPVDEVVALYAAPPPVKAPDAQVAPPVELYGIPPEPDPKLAPPPVALYDAPPPKTLD